MAYGHHMTLTPLAVKKNKFIQNEMTIESNEHTERNENSLRVQVFWGRLASFSVFLTHDSEYIKIRR